MTTWNYEGREWTLNQLHKRQDCRVSQYELQVNLIKRRKPVERALVEKLDESKSTRGDLHFLHGLWLTRMEIVELSQCEVSYWKLNKHLREGFPIEEAIKTNPVKQRRNIKKYIKTELKSVLKEIGSPYTDAQGSQISFNHREVSKYRPELSWDYIAAKKLNVLLEARKDEIELAKQLNEEDCTQRTKN